MLFLHVQGLKGGYRLRLVSDLDRPNGWVGEARIDVSSRGVGGSGHGYTSSLQPEGGAQSQHIDFHHPRFRFLMAPWALRAPSPFLVSSSG